MRISEISLSKENQGNILYNTNGRTNKMYKIYERKLNSTAEQLCKTIY